MVSDDVKEMVDKIMEGRKQLKRARKQAIKEGNWDDIILLLSDEDSPDVEIYRKQMENAGVSLEKLREIGCCSLARMSRDKKSGAIKIFFRKYDQSVFYSISVDGEIKISTVDYYYAQYMQED